MEKRGRVRLEDEETNGGGKGHELEDETRVRTDYLSFLVFLEAGQIKVSRVLNWGPVPPFSKCAICTFGSKISLKIAI